MIEEWLRKYKWNSKIANGQDDIGSFPQISVSAVHLNIRINFDLDTTTLILILRLDYNKYI
jgi:hypothetical protein